MNLSTLLVLLAVVALLAAILVCGIRARKKGKGGCGCGCAGCPSAGLCRPQKR